MTADFDIEAEQRLLGCILANFRRYYEVRGWVTPEHFADPLHGQLYELIAAEIESKGNVYHLHIPDEVLADVGGQLYLEQARRKYYRPSPGAAGKAGQTVQQCWLRRESKQGKVLSPDA